MRSLGKIGCECKSVVDVSVVAQDDEDSKIVVCRSGESRSRVVRGSN